MVDNVMKIMMGDLRHLTMGKHFISMPIGIGYIASYALAHCGAASLDVRLYDRPDILIRDLPHFRPHVLALSNYCWNANLSRLVFRLAKELNPDLVCISGGVEFPSERTDCREYLAKRPEIDFYVYREGETAFTELIDKLLQGFSAQELRSIPQPGVMSLHPIQSTLVRGDPFPRLTNLDVIPSPYLEGMMESWFDGTYSPTMETMRGCPFTCAYCTASNSWLNRPSTFSTQRIKRELTYMAQRMAKYPAMILTLCDTNFGMLKRDEEIAEHIRFLQDEFGWPNWIQTNTAKINYNRLLRISDIVRNRMEISCSVQSMNPRTLAIIRRKNLPLSRYTAFQKQMRTSGMGSVAEVICPLPEETKESYLEGIKLLIDSGVSRIITFTSMMLKQTPLASRELRERYGFQTKFRLIPGQFGEYDVHRCFEIEEVCVATNTMSFADYLDCRGLAFVSSLFVGEQYDTVIRHLDELGIDRHDFLMALWKRIKSGQTSLSLLYRGFLEETVAELWDSPEALTEHLDNKENYRRLLHGEIGDNLIRKYSTLSLLDGWLDSIHLAYDVIESLAQKNLTQSPREALHAARQWVLATRDLRSVVTDEMYRRHETVLELEYDVRAWYNERSESKRLDDYKRQTSYLILSDWRRIEEILRSGRSLYGDNLSAAFGKLLREWSPSHFWRTTAPVAD